MKVGSECLLIGAGPTGLILAQLLKLNGAAKVTLAANKGIKMDLAKKLNAGHEYIELDRENSTSQWEALKQNNPYGFDVVVNALQRTGWFNLILIPVFRSKQQDPRRSRMTRSTTSAGPAPS